MRLRKNRNAPKPYNRRFLVIAVVGFLLVGWGGLFLFFATDPTVVASIVKNVTHSSTNINLRGRGDVHGGLSNPSMPKLVTNVEPEAPAKKRVAYAVTVTKDGKFVDGALVLGYAAKRVHDASKGFPSEYDVDLVAFVVPSVVHARPILKRHGWRVLERPLPVALNEIKNKAYAEKMRDSGCCGADEFLKLWAYTLTEYERVIHLDMDSIVFQNMDELYKMDYGLIHTSDYNMGTKPVPPVQGGFLVVRPSMDIFTEFQNIIRKGDYGRAGWGGTHVGKFWGGQTIQGIMPYFYYKLHPGAGKEVNRCVYNCMVDNPYRPYKDDDAPKKCLDGKPTCQDCRKQDPANVKSAHFTICQKPWTCTLHTNPRNKDLCSSLHAQWFALREEFETEQGIDQGYRRMDTRFKESRGYCGGYGDNKYIPIPSV